MPLMNSPAFTALDVQAQMIALLNADPYIQATILKQDWSFNPVVGDDLTPGKVSQAEAMRLVFTLMGEGEEDATLGAVLGGTANMCSRFSALLYLYDAPNRTIEGKQKIVQATGIVRQALMRYRQSTGVPAGGSQQAQLWYGSSFVKRENLVSLYETPQGCRMSLTRIDLVSRYPFT